MQAADGKSASTGDYTYMFEKKICKGNLAYTLLTEKIFYPFVQAC